MVLWLLGILLILIGSSILFVSFYPSFGGDVDEERRKTYKQSPQFTDRTFKNSQAVNLNPSFSETLTIARKFFFTKVEEGRPKKDISVPSLQASSYSSSDSEPRLLWLGHSSFWLQINDKNILLDPVFSKVAAPHPWLGGKRFNKNNPIEIADLPPIDAVLISHDHYDHLDYETVLQLKDKVTHFYLPLGVGVHLEAWGISVDKITELDWWESK
ncbi:MAG: MBL fold metallo-hydrolase, partial [Flavobacteriaceae bacterium]|nr:MBL fold metallo-hydrolase [Flavobacteriaceae bacterium]